MNEEEISGPIPARYCPIFESLLDSSLWDEPYHVRLTFIAFLALKGMDDIVRLSPYKIAKRSSMKEEEVMAAIEVLKSPDKRRRENQLYEGRRIEKVDGGWLVLNGAYYRKMVTRINVLASKARWAREHRKKEKEKTGVNRMLHQKEDSSLPYEGAAMKAFERGDLDEVDRLALLPKNGKETPFD